MRATAKAMAAVLALATAAAQDVPDGNTDIVVTGDRPHVDAGMWTIERSPSGTVTTFLIPSHRAFSTVKGVSWRTCIARDALPDAVRQLLGVGRETLPEPGCSRLKIEVGDGRVTGRQTCRGGGVETKRRYQGQLGPGALDVSVTERTDLDQTTSETSSRLTARLIGRCPQEAPAATPPITPDPAPPAPVPRSDMEHDTSIPRRPPPPPVASEPDDIVVVARKLRLMRLHYGADGRILRFCHADVSSGDPRVDRIGCAVVRVCVRQGYDDKPSATACFYRQVDLIDPPPAER